MLKSKAKGEERLTPQRDAVLQVIREREDHPTANEIFELAKKRLPTLSHATVYNSLKYLKETGLVREICFGNGASRYDRATDRHDHAICSRCGRMVDFDLPEAAALMRAAARKSRFTAESVHLTLTGVCPGCREAT